MKWIRNAFGSRRFASDAAEEMEAHLQERMDELAASGMDAGAARQQAMREFGNTTWLKEEARGVWIATWLEQFIQDGRYALRMLRRNPGFTAIVLLTLAMGIGMNTAVFSVINASLLRPLEYPDSGRLVWLTDYDFLYEQRDNYVSRPAYLRWRKEASSFEGITAYSNQDLAVMANGESSQERIVSAAGEFWNVTGARAALGSLFRPGELHTMVISDTFHRRRFGGDPQVIGKTVSIDGYAFTITGVLAANFHFRFPLQFVNGDEVRDIDAYIPFPDSVMGLPELSIGPWDEAIRGLGPAPYHVRVVAKLKPGVTMDQARAEMEAVYARAAADYPAYRRKHARLHFDPLKEKLTGEARRALMALQGAVGFVLLIACANIANLLLARAANRRREMAIRASVGAGRVRVARQLLTESVILALLGGGAGLVVSQWTLALMIRLSPQAVPRLTEATIDGGVLGFTLMLSLAAGIMFGLAPALAMWKARLGEAVKSNSRLRVRGLLIAAQPALVIVLLTGAGLMLKSFSRMSTHSPGFAPDEILTLRVPLSGPSYRAWPPRGAYIQQLLDRTEPIHGIQAVGVDLGSLNTSTTVRGKAVFSSIRAVSTGYLRAMGAPLREGRWPEHGALFGVLVNESFVRSLAGGYAVGSRVTGSMLNDNIVGVVADFKYRQLDGAPMPEIYLPFERFPMARSLKVVIRTAGDPASITPAIRKTIAGIDRGQPVYEVQTLERALADSIAPRRFNMFLLGAFAATALLMALAGIYGVIAYAVAQRQHEIGIRLALGASHRQVVRMMVGQGMRVSLAGIAVGVVMALGLTRVIGSLLYDVKPNDPATFAMVAAGMAVAALVACAIPALQAAFVDPAVALRYE